MSYDTTFIGGAPLHVPHLEAYWRDPAAYEARRRIEQAKIDALFEPHEARIRAEKEAMWAAEERHQFTDASGVERENGL